MNHCKTFALDHGSRVGARRHRAQLAGILISRSHAGGGTVQRPPRGPSGFGRCTCRRPPGRTGGHETRLRLPKTSSAALGGDSGRVSTRSRSCRSRVLTPTANTRAPWRSPSPRVTVMQTAEHRFRDELPNAVHLSFAWRLAVQRLGRPIPALGLDVLSQRAPWVRLPHQDRVGRALPRTRRRSRDITTKTNSCWNVTVGTTKKSHAAISGT